MTAFLDAGRRPSRRAPHPREVWPAVFPLVVPPDAPDGLGVLLLDSNAQTHFSFTNALGVLPATQLRAAERAMAAWPGAGWLVCLHHHLVEYPRAGVALADRVATALTNGHWAVSRLRRGAARVVVLHGHPHTDWAGECGGLRILSAPSPVMGPADDAAARGFWLHAFAPRGGALSVLAPERVVVPGGAADDAAAALPLVSTVPRASVPVRALGSASEPGSPATPDEGGGPATASRDAVPRRRHGR